MLNPKYEIQIYFGHRTVGPGLYLPFLFCSLYFISRKKSREFDKIKRNKKGRGTPPDIIYLAERSAYLRQINYLLSGGVYPGLAQRPFPSFFLLGLTCLFHGEREKEAKRQEGPRGKRMKGRRLDILFIGHGVYF